MKRLTLQHAIDLAVEKGGLCLSTEYQGVDAKLLWQCAEGHTWEASLSRIRNSSAWCPTCAVLCKRLTLQHAKDLAAEKGGFCLSKEYINNRTKMLWQCAEGHTWEAAYDSIQQGCWCPTCFGNKKLTLQHTQDLASRRGGFCLSEIYINNSTKMLWQCAEGHTWETAYSKVYLGRWCPICATNTSRGENLCRLTLEQMLGTPFPKTRSLPWLVTPEGNHLELDGYAAKLRLGFEYNGHQHYNIGARFNTDTTVFESQQARDRLKRRLCAENDVLLLQVDYTWGLSEIPKVIFNLLVSFGFLPKVKPDEINVDSVYALGGGYSKDQLISDIKTFVYLYEQVPTVSAWDQYFHECGGSIACVATYQRFFGSWSEALSAAGYTAALPGWQVKYPSDDLLKPIVAYAQQNGCLPTSNKWAEYAKKNNKPSVATYYRQFGSWSSALALAQDELNQLNQEKNLNSP